MKEVIVLGVDPSLRNFGMVLTRVSRNGINVLETQLVNPELFTKKEIKRKGFDDLRRASVISCELRKMESNCDIVIAEIPIGSQSARAMANYGIMIGILSGCEKPIVSVSPSEVKKAVTGNNFADKKEIIDWAIKAHPEENWIVKKKKDGTKVFLATNEHLSDALAAIYAGIRTEGFKIMLKQLRTKSK
jgi:Holliday junction resolvasome RuvABC endonuclease subunit